MTRESRVLDVLHHTRQMNQGAVIKAARMDNTTCALVLRRLVALGLVEMTTYRNGREGRPAYLYRRVTTRREAA